MNKYLEKIAKLVKEAMVPSATKAYRRAAELIQSGSHDFHGTKITNLSSILNRKTIQAGTTGLDLSGKGVYLGKGRPAVGYEPSRITGQVAVPRIPDGKALPQAGIGGEDWILSKKPVKVGTPRGKSYVVHPGENRDILYQARRAKVRTIPSEIFNAAATKVHPTYDEFNLTRENPLDVLKSKLVGMRRLRKIIGEGR